MLRAALPGGQHRAIDLLRGQEVLGGPPGRAAMFSKCHESWSTEGARRWGLQPVQVPRGVKRGAGVG